MQEPTPNAFRLLDTTEACAVLRVSKATIHRMVRTGRLNRSSVSASRSLFPWSEIQRLVMTPLPTLRRVGATNG